MYDVQATRVLTCHAVDKTINNSEYVHYYQKYREPKSRSVIGTASITHAQGFSTLRRSWIRVSSTMYLVRFTKLKTTGQDDNTYVPHVYVSSTMMNPTYFAVDSDSPIKSAGALVR